MGVTLVGLSGLQRGIESEETGINTRSVTVRYYPEWKVKLPNYQNQTRGFAIPDKFSRDVTIEGEVSGATGLLALVLNAAATIANDISTWVAVTSGSNAGGLYMNEATETQTRDGWREVTIPLTSDPLVA